MKRKIAAILAADVVGYSRLMAEDEEETMRRLMSYRAVFDDFITKAEGRIFNTAGDAVLAEFPSAVDAVRAAIDIQESLRTRNMSYPPSRHMVFRIGLTIGDVIHREGDLLGDGVNVAARLQALAAPGGICVSRSVHEQVADKLSVLFSDLGLQEVKNIPRPVHAYQIQIEKGSLDQASARNSAATTEAMNKRSSTPFFIIAVLAIALGALGSYVISSKPWSRQETTSKAEAVNTLSAPLVANSSTQPTAIKSPSSNATAAPFGPIGDFSDGLTAILEKAAPKDSSQSRKETVSAFSALPIHRAMAVAPGAKRHWRTGGWPSRPIAEEKVLEKCEQFYGEQCALIAADDSLVPADSNGAWSTRNAPRALYAGKFDVEKIPGLREQQLRRPDILGYANATGPKAAAFHAEGILTVSTGAANQRLAEEQALSACNAYPDRAKSGNRPCYLYAVENRVVLPERLTSPLTPDVQSIQAVAPSAAMSATASFQSALLAAMQDIAPAMPENIRNREGSLYVNSGLHKALAMHPPYDSWRRTFLPDEKIAEEIALEACEVRHGDPCILLAVNEDLKQRSFDGQWQKRHMPRVSYSGAFDPQQIPTLTEQVRKRQDVTNYGSRAGSKAAALHPYGLIFVVTESKSQFEAEVKALSDCNEDPTRNGRDGPCWLYSVGNQVVLPQRSRFPISSKS